MLVVTAILQTHLKFKPQIIMIALGIITVTSYVLKLKSVTNLLFGLLLSLLLYVTFFSLYIWFLQVTGRTAQLMDIEAMIFSIVLTVLTTILYFWKFKRDLRIEKACSTGFLILTVVVFLIYEIRIFS
jgi:hypothetical protein